MATKSDLDYLSTLDISHNSDKSHAHITRPQLEHRINLVQNVWKVPRGSKVLEIGCGQGDCTIVLAAAVGEEGRIDAVDPCPLDYGSPWTVGEAQAHLKKGPIGSRIQFIQANPIDHLSTSTTVYDYVVLNHCLWYFDSPDRITELLSFLASKKHTKHILIAEWSLEAHDASQFPHVLAALIRASREYLDVESTQNIRTPVSPHWFRQYFEKHNLQLSEQKIAPPDGMMDGTWEVKSILSPKFDEQTAKLVRNDGQSMAIATMKDTLSSAVAQLEGGIDGVRSMMVWTAMI